jgi:hypothetical protein
MAVHNVDWKFELKVWTLNFGWNESCFMELEFQEKLSKKGILKTGLTFKCRLPKCQPSKCRLLLTQQNVNTTKCWHNKMSTWQHAGITKCLHNKMLAQQNVSRRECRHNRMPTQQIIDTPKYRHNKMSNRYIKLSSWHIVTICRHFDISVLWRSTF